MHGSFALSFLAWLKSVTREKCGGGSIDICQCLQKERSLNQQYQGADETIVNEGADLAQAE